MNDLYVIERERGTGVARELFQACHGYSKSNGFACMMWETDNDNKRAQRFYEKMGGKMGDSLHYWI